MYSNKILEIFKNPLNAGGLQGANAVGKYVDSQCGDQVKLYLKFNDGTIEEARFKAVGSVGTIVAASSICSCLLDCTIEEALKISKDRIYEITGQYPKDKDYTVDFAIKAVDLAIKDYYDRLEKELKKGVKKTQKIKEEITSQNLLEFEDENKSFEQNVIQDEFQNEEIQETEEKTNLISDQDIEMIDKYLQEAREKANDLAEISQRHFDSFRNVNIYPGEIPEQKKEEETSKVSKAKAAFDAMFEE